MFDLTADQLDALAQRRLKRRFFIWCEALDPVTGDPDPAGFWNDLGTITYQGRDYAGSGNVIKISTLSARTDISIPGITIELSGIATAAALLVRGSTVGQRPIEVKIGLYDVANKFLLEPLIPFFDGFVDDIQIHTPPPGGESVIRLICESTSRALTIESTDTRSDASCKAREPTDLFYSYTGLQRNKPFYFGRETPKTTPEKKSKYHK